MKYLAMGMLVGAVVGVLVRAVVHKEMQMPDAAWTCQTPWREMLNADGKLVGVVCYKPDGTRRIIMLNR